MGNAKYTSIPSRSLRSLPRSQSFVALSLSLSLSSSPSSSILRSVYVSRHISLSHTHTHTHTHTATSPPPHILDPNPREINVILSLVESSRPAMEADARRRFHLHCHYESTHVAREICRSCYIRLCGPISVCVRIRTWKGRGLTSIV